MNTSAPWAASWNRLPNTPTNAAPSVIPSAISWRISCRKTTQPTLETIKDGSYPLTTALCLITRKDDPNPNVQKMIDFMLSPDGQEIVEKTGYAGVGE